MTILKIPTPFRPYTNGTSEITLQAQSVGEAINEVTEKHPALHNHLIAEDGSLRSFVNLYLNGEDIRYLQELETPLQKEDTLQIIPSIAGG